jgi:hypothetical protein
MPTPSLLIVPARFKSGKMYSQVPTSGTGDFTVTRATAATRVNASGLIESVASGIPRLDYFASGGAVGCPALLVEPSGTNLALRSNDFTVTGTWTPNDTTIISTDNLSPDGTNNATRIRGASGANQVRQQVIVGTSGAVYVGSVWIRRVSGTSAFLLRVANAVAGSVLSISPTTTWQRYSFSSTATSTTVRLGFVFPNDTDEFEIWGAQLETGSVATSYIPTTTAAVTRNADVITKTGVSGLIGQTEGTIYAEVDVRNLGFTRSFINVQDSTITSNAVRVECNASNQWRIQIRAATVSVLDQTITSPTFTTGIYKIAMAYNNAASGVVFAVNGSIIYTNASAITMPSGMDRVNLGTRFSASFFDYFFNDRIRAAALYTTRLTNAQLAALTTP